ncbi:hypothetical protein BDN72DRAFT_867555 [Pluteus cervinus]|uniref:Uncharacterized protein n=1 Tax=Pluteus cervinus TaxID=181527 RepID=A0ACD3BDS1_9AGAR|nr:hypothetical protein BDN72DRAFT_867555 [Pluteus cervinus]
MPKRALSPESRSAPQGASDVTHKRQKPAPAFEPVKVASADAAAAVDRHPPLPQLLKAVREGVQKPLKGTCIVYWMRMADIRITDNKALSLAASAARHSDLPLVAVFVISPQDYIAHDRSARRIDFTLRNLALLKESFSQLHVPFHVVSHEPRKDIPKFLLSFLKDIKCNEIYANIEYEVDELRRDIQLCELANPQGIKASFVHNKCIVEPGAIIKKDGGSYAVYSPYQKAWIKLVDEEQGQYLCKYSSPEPNDKSIRKDERFAHIFDTPVPEDVQDFTLGDVDSAKMAEVWPAGENAANEILQRFLRTKARAAGLGAVNPLASGAEKSVKNSRIQNYELDRDRADKDTTSRLSLYLSSGVLSPRECIRAAMKLSGNDHVDGNRQSGIGRWIQEIAWRDFYTSVLASFPRVSMGRPFLEKYASVVWENHQSPGETNSKNTAHRDSEALKRWKSGTTGVPIVDATMRCIQEMGWVHNRLRMITAMFLVKDLMIDWRVGERYFMEQLIDGDLASNNGGWQWCASTGVDPCPYFRIFNPYSQSSKADPTGNFIRHWVPELRKLKGQDLHRPSPSAADKFGYPRAIVDHEKSRERALRRYKNPGQK